MQFDVKSKKEFIQLYRQKYRVDNSVIDEFEHHYDMHTPIWWYTQHACLSDMINQAFRLQDINISIKAGFLIQDLHKQIEKLYRPPSEKLTLYRGQRLTYAHFEELRMMQDGLFSFNSFLSTSIDQNVALYHADCSRHDSDRIGVVFEIKIDPMAVIFTPFCSLDNNSDLKREFLFTMFTVFRIGKMKQLEDRLWQVELSLTSDNDHDVKQLTNYIHQTTQGSTGWDRLGKLLLKMGHFDKAENVFQTLIANSAKNDFKGLGHRYHQMGLVKQNTGLYKKAMIFYNKAIKMYQTSTYSNYSDFSTIHNDIGSLYQYTEEYTKALRSYQIAVDIEKESNPVNYSNLAIIYDNIAEVNKNMKQYSTALQFYKIVLKIHRKCIPLNFQKISTAYRKIAEMHFNIKEYPEALRLFQKIFHIQQYSLPPNYIDTATIENNIGQVYERMGEHSKASEHYRNAFKCYQPVLDVLLESHTQNVADLAIIYNNIAAIQMNMKDFVKALEFYKKTLEILKKFPHVKKPDLAATYDNIGQVYQNMYDYSNAFLLYSKATRVARQSSPVNPSQVRLYKTHLEVAIGKLGDSSRMVISQTTEAPNYSCNENNAIVKVTLSLLPHSASYPTSNCSLQQCIVSSSNNDSCRSSSTPCFDYLSHDNNSYCAPGILCSILEACDNITFTCTSNTSVCIVNSCCLSQAVCLPLLLTNLCTRGWLITGSTNNTRYQHTSSLLANGKVLVSGGYIYGGSLNSAELYDPSIGTWAMTGYMTNARQSHTASALTNGKVLVTGGYNFGNYLNSAELYDPSAGTWTMTGNMAVARDLHTASVLANGNVLVTGGLAGSGYLNSSELYNPSTGTWVMTGYMTNARRSHTASTLTNGKVLVTGGGNGSYALTYGLNSSELYDPSTGTWTMTGNIKNARYYHTASVLTNGKVLISGGLDSSGNPLYTAELYDPSTGTWAVTGYMTYARYYHTASVLTNGKVLVSGGMGLSFLNTAELYDPSTETWTITSHMTNVRYYHAASVLNNGKVLVSGGNNGSAYLNSAELY